MTSIMNTLEPVTDPLENTVQMQVATKNPVWGSTIPVSFGYRGIEGKCIWASDARILKETTHTPASIYNPPPPPLPPLTWSIIPVGGGWSNGGPIMKFDGLPGGQNPFAGWDASEADNTPVNVEATTTTVVTAIKADFAVAFGYQLEPVAEQGTLRLLKIYAEDNILIYDATDPTGAQRLPGLGITFHPGDPEAMPDATILATMGADKTPAFRNLIYIVFKDFPLLELGLKNKLPKITAVFWNDVSEDGEVSEFTLLDDVVKIDNASFGIDWKRGYAYGWSGVETLTPTLHQFTLNDMQEIRRTQVDLTPYSASSAIQFEFAATYDFENGLFFGQLGISNSNQLIAIDINSGVVVGQFGTNNNSGTNSDIAAAFAFEMAPIHTDDFTGIIMHSSTFKRTGIYTYGIGNGNEKFKFGADITYDYFLSFLRQGDEVTSIDTRLYNGADVPRGICSYRVPDSKNRWYAFMGLGGSLHLIHGIYGLVTGDTIPALHVDKVTRLQRFTGCQIECLFVDPADGNLVILMSQQLDETKCYIAKAAINVKDNPESNGPYPAFGGFLYIQSIPTFANVGNFHSTIINNTHPAGGVLGYPSGNSFVTVSLASGRVQRQIAIPTNLLSSGSGYGYDPVNDLAYGSSHASIVADNWPTRIKWGRAVDGTIPLSDVVEWLALRIGYEEDDVLITGLEDPVLGGIIDTPTSIWTILQNLSKVFNFDYFQSDGKLKVVSNINDGTAEPAYTIEPKDMAPLSSDDEKAALLTTIGATDEIPSDVQINYIDPALRFKDNSQTFRRPQFPFRTTATSKLQIYSVPLVMENGEVYYRAAVAAYNNHAASQSHAFQLSRKYGLVEPSDTIVIPVNGFEYSVRLTEVVYNGDDTISVAGRENSWRSDVEVAADEVEDGSPDRVVGPSDSKPLLVETNLVAPGDEPATPRPVVYAGVGTLGQPFWRSAKLSEREKNVPWTDVRTVTNPVPYGYATEALATVVNPHRTQNDQGLTVASISIDGTDIVSTVAYWWLLTGVNTLIVGAPGRWEIVYFQDVEILSGKLIRFKKLLRGRRGTEGNCNNHLPGDTVILLRWASLANTGIDTGQGVPPGSRADLRALYPQDSATTIGDDLAIRALGEGVTSAPPTSQVALTAAALLPWAPGHIVAQHDGGDIDITWKRRTRLMGAWLDEEGEVSLDETDERYDLQILSLDGSTVLRTVEDLLVSEYTYSAADQATDGYVAGDGDQIRLRIYQVSEYAGRGYPSEKLVDVRQ